MFQLITLLVVGLTTFAVSDIEYNTTDDVEIMEMRTENQRVLIHVFLIAHFMYNIKMLKKKNNTNIEEKIDNDFNDGE